MEQVHVEQAYTEIISRYIRGRGIILSRMPLPFHLPGNVDIKYNGDHLLGSDKFDFCIVNDVPQISVKACLDVLKPGGILFMSYSSSKDITFVNNSLQELCLSEPILFKTLESRNAGNVQIYAIEKDTFLDNIVQMLKLPGESPVINLDVVIPVYNAYDYFVKCLYSVLKYRTCYRIIAINDKSTDPRIKELFSTLKPYEREWMVLIENEVNSGFVKTVNKGMGYSRNDVVLLNSDTIVTKGWAEKLKSCAYSRDEIATVTPFTNNGTICSIPDFCQGNDVPEGYSVDDFAEMIERISLRQYCELPTAVGFCMFIKRRVIDEVGLFDDKTFGKGYGEENDFCMRAYRHGYSNVIADDTFVFHNGEASFSKEKDELCKLHLDILSKRYPDYMPWVSRFCETNPLSPSHKNIRSRMLTWDPFGKLHVLYVLHHYGGGTESHVNDLIDSLSDSQVSYVLQVFNKKVISLKEYNNGQCLCYTFNLDTPIELTTFHDSGYKNIVRRIVNTFAIDVIHVHHLIGHTLDVFDIAKEHGIPIIFTAHDYYVICPQIYMLDENSIYCKENLNLMKCEECLNKTLHFSRQLLYEWRYEFRKALYKCDRIITPTKCVKDTLVKYYCLNDDAIKVIGHGHNNYFASSVQKSPYNGDRPLNIAYIGVMTQHKGSDVLCELSHLPELKDNVSWNVIGLYDLVSDKGYEAGYNITFFGKYNDFNHLQQIIYENKIDIVILPSIWPETFSYTLSEAWAVGLPVIVSGLGALKERVRETGGGWIVDIYNIENIKATIDKIIQSPIEYEEKKNMASHITLKSLEKMRQEYLAIYIRVTGRIKTGHIPQLDITNNELCIALQDLKKTTYSAHELKYTDPNQGLRIDEKIVKCYSENGLSYTIRRIPVYIKEKLSSQS
jgi:GT2 family glycosyltransferase/glycosyltransferase involved in cell wall biosynthesis